MSGSERRLALSLRNPWSWKFAAWMIALTCFTAGMSLASLIRDGDGLLVLVLSLISAVINAYGLKRGFQWEREFGGQNARAVPSGDGVAPESKLESL